MQMAVMLLTVGGALGLCGGLAWLLDHAGAVLFRTPEVGEVSPMGDSAAA